MSGNVSAIKCECKRELFALSVLGNLWVELKLLAKANKAFGMAGLAE